MICEAKRPTTWMMMHVALEIARPEQALVITGTGRWEFAKVWDLGGCCVGVWSC